MTMTLGFVIAAISGLLSFVGGLLLVIAGFRDSTKWGLLNLFVPFAALVFTFTHWTEAKKGFLMNVAGIVLAPVAVIMIIGGAAASMGEQMEQQMAMEMQRQMQEAQASQQGFEMEPVVETAQDVSIPEPSTPAPPPARVIPVEAEPVQVAELPDVGVPLSKGEPIGAVDPDDAGRHLGERFKFIGRDGSLFFGELLAVEGSHLRVKREMQGGMVEYGVPKKELAELRPIY